MRASIAPLQSRKGEAARVVGGWWAVLGGAQALPPSQASKACEPLNCQPSAQMPCCSLFSFYQVTTAVSATYMITLPSSVERHLEAFSWISFELEGLGLPLACMGLDCCMVVATGYIGPGRRQRRRQLPSTRV